MPKAIDSHAHVFVQGLHLAARHRYVPNCDASAERFLGLLDANGVGRAVLVQPSFLGMDNGSLLAALRAHPGRFRAVAVLPEDTARPELDRLGALGVVGVRLNLIGEPDPEFTSPRWNAYFEELRRAGWLVEVQVEAARLPRIAQPILDRGLRLVVDHFGRPDLRLGIDDPGFRFLRSLGAKRGTWVKLSGEYRLGPGPAGPTLASAATHALLDNFGADRLVWGSDWPHTQFESLADYSSTHDALAKWVGDNTLRSKILEQTPARLFGFDDPVEVVGSVRRNTPIGGADLPR